jgi:hypothetical protein
MTDIHDDLAPAMTEREGARDDLKAHGLRGPQGRPRCAGDDRLGGVVDAGPERCAHDDLMTARKVCQMPATTWELR